MHWGRTNNKPQFHFGRTECPEVSSLRRTISRMGRTMSVTDRYFKACTSSITLPSNYILSLDYFIWYKNGDITFLTVFIPTYPVNFPCVRNRSTQKKPTTFGRALTDSSYEWATTESNPPSHR
jgi:hypothetical protein